MVTVEYSPEFRDRRNPLIPRVNPDRQADVLRSEGIPDKDIVGRKVIVSSEIISQGSGINRITRWGEFNRENNDSILYAGARYPDLFETLALSLAYGRKIAIDIAASATEAYHTVLRETLLHEASHDGDNYKGIDLGENATRNAFIVGFLALGVAAGATYTELLLPESKPLVHAVIGSIIGAPMGYVAGHDKSRQYKLDIYECFARKAEKTADQVDRRDLVDTVPNPDVDLDYIHLIQRNGGPKLAISNRQVLDLRFAA